MLMKGLMKIVSPGGVRARLSIFIFHRVLTAPDPLDPSDISAEQFDRMCRWIAEWFDVLPLPDAVTRLQECDLPERAAAITFDDGYADNETVAAPVLKRHGLPATFFVASGFLDGGVMWNDVVVESVRRTELGRLDLRGMALPFQSLALEGLPARRSAIDNLIAHAKYLPPAERERFVGEVSSRAEVPIPVDLMMTSPQVIELHRQGFEIGGHTVTHPILAKLSTSEARTEIETGKRALEALTGAPVRLFAYPNGRPGVDYTAESIEVVRGAGFEAAVSTAWGACTFMSDRFQLPRFTPWDRTRAFFGLRMARNARTQADVVA